MTLNPQGWLRGHAIKAGLPVTESEVEKRIRLAGAPTDMQARQGAAITGVYYPPQPPYDGHAEDLLFTEGDNQQATRFWFWFGIAAAVAVVGAAAFGLFWP